VTGARAFVTGVYAHYPTAGRQPMFDPLGKDERSVFDAALIDLIAEDQRLTPDGDVPELDGDPLCDCQDDGGLTFDIGEVRATGKLTAQAKVMRIDPQAAPQASPITLDLVKAGGRWRVHDIHTPDTPSLRDFLAKANKERAAKPASK
jgi:hypothetical protein